jgi:Fe-S-cluster containining protein
MFERIYAIYEKEIAEIPFACKEGCSACCIQSVTMTTAEGKAITTFLAEQGRSLPTLPDTTNRPQPGSTTNGLAACCLAGKEPPVEPEVPWVYEPCVFLEDERCTIYPVRPFGCRSFGSTRCCADHGIAEAPDWFITLNTVVNQLLEHLDRDGCWGNMIDVLNYLDWDNGEAVRAGNKLSARLLPTQSLPGFLIPPGEEAIISRFWEKLVKSGLLGDRL